MISVKRIVLSLLVLPLLLFLTSFIFSQPAHAQITYTCSTGIIMSAPSAITKQETQTKYTVKITNRASTTCTFTPFVSEGANVANWNFSFSSTTIQIPANSFKNIIVTAKPPSSWLNNPSNNGFRLRLKLNGTQISAYKDIDYPASYAPNCNAKPTLTVSSPNGTSGNGFKTYDLKLVNNDGAGCSVTKFNLAAITPNITTWKTQFLQTNGTSVKHSPVSLAPKGWATFKLKVTPPGDATAGNKNIQVLAGGSGVATDSLNLTYNVPAPAPKPITYKFSGYPFLDTNGDGRKDSNEKCFVGAYVVQLDSKNNYNFTGKENCSAVYSVSKTSTVGHVNVKLLAGSSVTATKLSYMLQSNPAPQVVTGNNVNLSGNASVYFGLNKTTPPPSDCDRKTPLFEVTEPRNGERSGKRGEEKKYTIKVTNKDSGKCEDQVFVLTRERVPSNFNARFDDATLKIAKGGHKSTTLHVTPQNDAAKGRSTVNVGLKRQGKEIARALTLGYTVEVKSPPPTAKPTKKPTAKPTKKPTDGPAPKNCERKTPEFTVTPDSREARAGEGVKHTMVIKNKDQGPCDARHLTLEAKLPASTWRSVFAKESLDIAKGGQATIDVVITSPTGAASGSNKITLNLKNNEGTIINTKNVSYVVTGFDGNGLISVRLGVDGIGTTPRIPIGGNKNPENENRNITLQLFDTASNALTQSWTDWTFTYNPTTQKFENELALSNDFPTGTYNVYAQGPGFIRARLPGSATITKGQTTNIHSDNFYLITGNINNSDISENRVDIMDYSVLISCSIYSQDTSLCEEDPNYASYSDLNNDGRVDEDDYTLFLKEFGNEGAILP